MSERGKLSAVVAKAWRSFDSAASLKSRVSPAMPILFFGDLDARPRHLIDTHAFL